MPTEALFWFTYQVSWVFITSAAGVGQRPRCVWEPTPGKLGGTQGRGENTGLRAKLTPGQTLALPLRSSEAWGRRVASLSRKAPI